jgi:hypothetical protein
MSKITRYIKVITVSIGLVFLTSLASARVKAPDTTPEGLVRVKKSKADLVYVLPTADMTQYTEIMLMDPYVAFNKDWQSYYNNNAGFNDQISDDDMQKMIGDIKSEFMKVFPKELEKQGFTVVTAAAKSVLIVRPAIVNVQVSVPDPDKTKGMGFSDIHTEDAGAMTFYVELYDSVSQQILARAYDAQNDIAEGWMIPRDYMSNKAALDNTVTFWAKMLAKGITKAKTVKPVLVEVETTGE